MSRSTPINSIGELREGDLVTITMDHWGRDAVARGPVVFNQKGATVCGVAINRYGHLDEPDPGVEIISMVRPLPIVSEELGAVYGTADSVGENLVACVAPGDDGAWLGDERATAKIGHKERRWLRTAEVQALVDQHGYVRLDKVETAS